MAISLVDLTVDTFGIWLGRCNQLINVANQLTEGIFSGTGNITLTGANTTLNVANAALFGRANITTDLRSNTLTANVITVGATLTVNGASFSTVYGLANTANAAAVGAFAQANTGVTNAGAAFGASNTAQATAAAAFGQANSATTLAGVVSANAVAAFGQANTANVLAFNANANAASAFGKANGVVQTGFTIIAANGVNVVPSSNADTVTLIPSSNVSIVGNASGKNVKFDLVNSGATAGSYGSSNVVPVITIDAKGRVISASNVTIASPGFTWLGSNTASNSNDVSFTSLINSTYNKYMLDFSDVIVNETSTPVPLLVQVSTDNGSSWKTTGYVNNLTYLASASPGFVSSTQGILLMQNVYINGTGADNAIAGEVYFGNVNSVTNKCPFGGSSRHAPNGAGTFVANILGGRYDTAGAAINAIRVIASTNTFSGNFALFGIKK
jgi:hypothetical protein